MAVKGRTKQPAMPKEETLRDNLLRNLGDNMPPPNPVVESVKSILALLRGMGPVLVSSSPNQTETIELLANLKDPITKEDV